MQILVSHYRISYPFTPSNGVEQPTFTHKMHVLQRIFPVPLSNTINNMLFEVQELSVRLLDPKYQEKKQPKTLRLLASHFYFAG